MIKRLIVRVVVLALIIGGVRYAISSKKSGNDLTEEQQYSQKMSELSERNNAIEKEVQDANAKAVSQPAKTPGSGKELLDTLTKAYQEKDKYLADLQAIDVPKKYEEAHSTFLAWQKQEHETEGKLIDGYKAYNEGKKEVAATIDLLVESSTKVSKAYESKLADIAKKNGFDSIQKFLSQKESH